MTGLKRDINSLSRLQDIQLEFSELFFDREDMTRDDREEMTRSFALALHSEISSMVGEISFRDHVSAGRHVDTKKILYETVDAFRYMLAILNLWGHTTDNFLDAFENRDAFLHTRYQLEKRQWSGEPVVIVDIDEVVCGFRTGFTEWIVSEKGVDVDVNSPEYYHIQPVKDAGLQPEGLFEEFIDNANLRHLPAISLAINAINELKRRGFWIHLLTARPAKNMQCLYDTYFWLNRSGLDFDRVSFSPEKMIWLTKSDYFNQGTVVCAIDDSVKHTMEYAKHGIRVMSPTMSYNEELYGMHNVTMYSTSEELLEGVLNLAEVKNG
jgi:hypothetical protein